MHNSSFLNMKRFEEKYLKTMETKKIKILDVGSQDVNGTYKSIFEKNGWEYFGCDMVTGKNVDIVVKNPYNWKNIKSGSFDVVISGQAFEHIEYFWITILEIERVLKEEGFCCIIAPSAGVEHKYPVDCWRFYPDGFRALAKYAGLEILEVYMQNDKEIFKEYDPVWHDCVLIAKNRKKKLKEKLSFAIRNRVLRINKLFQ